MTYTSSLDYAGRAARQRKPRVIDVDTREPDPVTLTLLRGEGYTVNVRSMLVGDYGWDIRPEAWLSTHLGCQRFVAERKTLADLRDVVRLQGQLHRMRETLHREQVGDQTFFVVLLEYKFDTDRKRKWTDKAIRHAKLSIQLGGVRVTECEENEVADAISGLYVWSQKSKHEVMGG